MKQKLTALALLTGAVLTSAGLTGCGGGSDSSTSPTPISTAQFTFQVSDAPVDQAVAVVLCFNAIELTGNGAGVQRFQLGTDAVAAATNNSCLNNQGQVIANTRGVDLLQLQGAQAFALVSGATVPAGDYGQLRLVVADGSYVQHADGTRQALTVPSNEIKLKGPVLSAGGTFNYTLEFDLRKAMVAPNSNGNRGYLLKPTGLRLVDTSAIGHLQGTVAESLLLDAGCPVVPQENRLPVAAVYLYKGADLPIESLSDYGGVLLNSPYASAPVLFDGASQYNYQLGFVDAGTYTAAVTCQLTDDPEQADMLSFIQLKNVTISAGKIAQILNF